MRTPAPFAASVLALVTATAAAIVVPVRADRSQSPQAPREQQPAQPPPAQQPPAQQTQQEPDRAQQPIRTGINFVRVDVIVSDRNGEPVLDLKPEEFAIQEDGKPQKIESFQVVKVDSLTQMSGPAPREISSPFEEKREAARADVRLFIILLDDYHVRRGNDMAVRKPLIDFVQNQLGPADMVAIMYPLTPVTDLTFTRNRDGLVKAIENFEGRRFEYNPRNEFEQRYAYYPAASVEKIRNDVTMSALEGAAVKLGTMREGRKSIIFVSEGFSGTLPPQLNDPVANMPGLGNPARGRPEVAADERAEFRASTEMLSQLQDIFREANRYNTSIYAVDPRGLAAFEYDINQGVGLQTDRRHLESSLDTLRALAANTDGRAIVNRNDLASGMKQIIRDSSGYYLIGYNSTESPTDGKFHEIRVRVSRRGVDVRARKGYWAYTAEDAARATATPAPEAPSAVSDALNEIAEPPRGRSARFWVGTSRGENGRTKVTFVWEPVAPGPGEQRPASESPATVAVTAVAPDGTPIFRGRVPEGPAGDGGPAVNRTSAGASTTFEASPGEMQMRMVVEGADGQVLDSASRELTLPDFTVVQVSFGTPLVFRGRTAREIQTLKATPGSVPTAERHFSRTDRVFARVQAFAPGGVVPAVTARLLNNKGDAMADLPVQSGPAGATELDLPLGNLAPGNYLIEFSALTDSGTARELLAFNVGR
jgi:VWFA-related protein